MGAKAENGVHIIHPPIYRFQGSILKFELNILRQQSATLAEKKTSRQSWGGNKAENFVQKKVLRERVQDDCLQHQNVKQSIEPTLRFRLELLSMQNNTVLFRIVKYSKTQYRTV